MTKLKAPFPYFGGKSRIASDFWEEVGPVKGYIEPFAGSIAVCLACPWPGRLKNEVINDLDGMITNAWRAIKFDPDAVKDHIDWPMSEIDLHSRSEWIDKQRKGLESKLRADPEYYNAKIAGWYIWGLGCSIGDAFIEQKKAIPSITGPRGVFGQNFDPDKVFKALSNRLKNTRITNGDWGRVVKESVLTYQTPVAVFLDPPYSSEDRHDTYKHESYSVASEVNEWCKVWGNHEDVRIVLAGYAGDYDLPDDWKTIHWKTAGGYANIQRVGESKQGKENADKERLWVSPSCVSDKSSLLDQFDIDDETQ